MSKVSSHQKTAAELVLYAKIETADCITERDISAHRNTIECLQFVQTSTKRAKMSFMLMARLFVEHVTTFVKS